MRILTFFILFATPVFTARAETLINIAIYAKSDSLRNKISSVLINRNYLKIYERKNLKKILNELVLQQSAIIKTKKFPQLDSLDFLVFAKRKKKKTYARVVAVSTGQVTWVSKGDTFEWMAELARHLEAKAAQKALRELESDSEGILVDLTSEKETYKKKDKLKFYVTSEKSGYLYLLNLQSDGTIVFLLPNSIDQYIRLKAGKSQVIPPESAEYEFEAGKPYGFDVVKAIVTTRKLDLSGTGADIAGDFWQVLAEKKIFFARGMSVRLKKLLPAQWGSATLQIRVKKK